MYHRNKSDKIHKSVPAKLEPFVSDMVSFKKSIDQQFENLFSSRPFMQKLPSLWRTEMHAWKPEIDMYETNKEIIVKADVPGCEKNDVRIKVDNNMLTISGEKKEEKEIRKENFYHKEQHMGSFFRSVALPDYTNISKARANYENGVVKIIFPKTKSAHLKGRTIEISSK